MTKKMRVFTSLDANPDSFIKSISKVSQPSSFMRAYKGDRRKGSFITVVPDEAWQNALPALSELEQILLAMAHSGIKKVAGKAFQLIKKYSGPQGGIQSTSLSKSWRMKLYKRARLRALIYSPGSVQSSLANGGNAGTLLFGYGIRTTDEKFLRPIPLKRGTTDLLEILEYGSRPHIIRPKKRGGRLRFQWDKSDPSLPIEGTNTFLGFYNQFVRHPGTRPYAFTRIAVASAAGGMLAVQAQMKVAKFKILGAK